MTAGSQERYRVVITPSALRDIDQIAQTISEDSPVNAARFISRLKTAIHLLNELPSRGTHAPEGVVDGHIIRQIMVGKYRILYAIVDRTVVVLTIRHAARLPL